MGGGENCGCYCMKMNKNDSKKVQWRLIRQDSKHKLPEWRDGFIPQDNSAYPASDMYNDIKDCKLLNV